MTRFGRRNEDLPDLMAEAALATMTDAGVEHPAALVVAAMNPEEFTGEGNYGSLLGTRLGLSRVPAIRVETATSSGAAAVVRDHRPLHRRPRAGLRHHDARAGRPHHARADAPARGHPPGDLPGRGQEPRPGGP